MSDFLKRVSELQTELKAPKGQMNKFGGYRYRSCEDILEAVKPLLHKHGMVLTVSDDLMQFDSRFYVCATATLRDTASDEFITNSAYAREAETKKGMDESQITGTASSYARKYALNGLFCIDDTKDADTDEYTARTQNSGNEKKLSGYTCAECKCEIEDYFDGKDTIPAAAMAKRSKERYGSVLCIKCARKKK